MAAVTRKSICGSVTSAVMASPRHAPETALSIHGENYPIVADRLYDYEFALRNSEKPLRQDPKVRETDGKLVEASMRNKERKVSHRLRVEAGMYGGMLYCPKRATPLDQVERAKMELQEQNTMDEVAELRKLVKKYLDGQVSKGEDAIPTVVTGGPDQEPGGSSRAVGRGARETQVTTTLTKVVTP